MTQAKDIEQIKNKLNSIVSDLCELTELVSTLNVTPGVPLVKGKRPTDYISKVNVFADSEDDSEDDSDKYKSKKSVKHMKEYSEDESEDNEMKSGSITTHTILYGDGTRPYFKAPSHIMRGIYCRPDKSFIENFIRYYFGLSPHVDLKFMRDYRHMISGDFKEFVKKCIPKFDEYCDELKSFLMIQGFGVEDVKVLEVLGTTLTSDDFKNNAPLQFSSWMTPYISNGLIDVKDITLPKDGEISEYMILDMYDAKLITVDDIYKYKLRPFATQSGSLRLFDMGFDISSMFDYSMEILKNDTLNKYYNYDCRVVDSIKKGLIKRGQLMPTLNEKYKSIKF
jgi:hypothetical protein